MSHAPQKIFVSQSKTTTVICPACGKTKTADVTQYLKLDRPVTVRCKCVCGQTYSFLLERRKKYRKAVNLPGSYIMYSDGKEIDRGRVLIVDISLTGLKLKFTSSLLHDLRVGHRLLISFQLDDRERTPIQKEVTVKSIDGSLAGVAFCEADRLDNALGFYMFG